MKRFMLPLLAAAALVSGIVMIACEKHKDPFSAQNSAPAITNFVFKPDVTLPDPALRVDGDSLKYRAGDAYAIALAYNDAEAKSGNVRTLRANFKFLAGSGRISSSKFSNPSDDGLSFDIPALFNNNDEIFLTPTKPGIVDLQLKISDGVKESEAKTASTIFFKNLPPVVRFRSDPSGQTGPPYRVDFDASASVDRDGTIKNYIWSFGDGENPITTQSSNIRHDYQKSGIFTVRLIVTDNEDSTASLDRVVSTINQSPTAVLSIDTKAGKAPLLIKYDARGSRDRDGSIVAYDISFGDGKSDTARTGSHQYLSDNAYTVTLTVRDNLGAIGTTTETVTVETPPIALLHASPDSGAFPLSVMLDGSGSYDPQGGQIIEPQISITGQNVQQTYNQLSVTHIFKSAGEFRVTLQVKTSRDRNNANLIGRDEKVVRAINKAPIADFTWVRDLGNVTFTSTSKDPNEPDDKIENYTWDFGDRTSVQSGPTLSTVTHTYAVSGIYIAQLTVFDGELYGTKKDTLEVK
jgi:PKD repeat protein